MVTEVLGGGKFYVQAVADQKVASVQQQLASLNLKEAPVLGSFNPKKGDIVLCLSIFGELHCYEHFFSISNNLTHYKTASHCLLTFFLQCGLLFSMIPPEIVGKKMEPEQLNDAVNLILSLQVRTDCLSQFLI